MSQPAQHLSLLSRPVRSQHRALISAPLRLMALSVAVAAALSAPLAMAQSDDYAEVNRLMRAGQLSDALTKVDAYLSAKPKDPQMRFLKGVIQTEGGKPADAIATFSKLTEEFPELPEPYNNLAVLYAGQSQFDKARAALEMAIRTNPSYATAHENLGDVYAKLASQAYSKALQLDSGNTAVAPKLSLIRNLFGADSEDRPCTGTSARRHRGRSRPGSSSGRQSRPPHQRLPLPPAPTPAMHKPTSKRRLPPGPRPGPAATCPATWVPTPPISRQAMASPAAPGKPNARHASFRARASRST